MKQIPSQARNRKAKMNSKFGHRVSQMRPRQLKATQRGWVSLELAMSMFLVVAILLALFAVQRLVTYQGALYDSATQIARMAARHDSANFNRMKRQLPKGAKVKVESRDGVVKVSVADDVALLPGWPTIPVSASASMLEEGT